MMPHHLTPHYQSHVWHRLQKRSESENVGDQSRRNTLALPMSGLSGCHSSFSTHCLIIALSCELQPRLTLTTQEPDDLPDVHLGRSQAWQLAAELGRIRNFGVKQGFSMFLASFIPLDVRSKN